MRGVKTPRFETFSDAVFAIGITLLILEIKVPHGDDLARGLIDLWPSFAAYVASFLYIGTWWMSHHLIGDHIAELDGGALFLNLIFLMTISFIPFPTAVLADRIAAGDATGIAAAFYGASMLLTTIAGNVFVTYALRRRLFGATLPERLRRFLPYRWIGTALYAASVPLALVLPLAAFAFFVASPVFYAGIFARERFIEAR